MELKIYQNINECRKLWDELSPNKNLFDIWDFRQCFYDREDNKPYFIVGREGAEIIGFVPLYFVKSRNQYTYFGGWFPERNSFFLKERSMLPHLLEGCPDNTLIEGISAEEGKYYSFLEDEYTYYIDLSKYENSFEKYFSSFDRKKQKNFKRELKNMPKYKVYKNRLRDFNRLVELNIRQFAEESIYMDESVKNSLRKMVALANKMGILQMISVEVNGKTEGIDVGIAFNDWYHVVVGSSNNQKIPNLGKVMTILSIKNAIANKSKFVDFLASSGYWKSQWNFDKEMMFKFIK